MTVNISQFERYKSQSMADELITEGVSFGNEQESLYFLRKAQQKNQTFYIKCLKSDADGNLIVEFSPSVLGIVPLQEVTYKLDKGLQSVHKGRADTRVGLYIPVKVKDIQYDKKGGKHTVICSRKEAVQEIYDKYLKDVQTNKLKPGMMVTGVVTGWQDYGAFIDLGGDFTGIMSVADISRSYVKHPKEVLQIGQKLDLYVKQTYQNPLRLALSRCELLDDWDNVDDKFKVNETVPGIIKNRMATGIFVQLSPSFEGIAEFNGSEYKYGQEVPVKILVIDKTRRKIKLAIVNKT